MIFYPDGNTSTITVPFTNSIGAEVTPSAATARLLNGEGVQIVDLGALVFANDAVSVDVAIPGINNVLADDEMRAVRILSVLLTFPEGNLEKRISYGVERAIKLVTMENSFMTYETAHLISMEAVNPIGWLVADENMRKTGLAEAYRRLVQIPMKYNPRDLDGTILREQETVILRDEWISLTYDDFAAFPLHFRAALRRAQFVETNELLKQDPAAARRRAGVIAESIGESSVRLSDSIVDYGISTETLSVLTGYIYFSMRIGRA